MGVLVCVFVCVCVCVCVSEHVFSTSLVVVPGLHFCVKIVRFMPGLLIFFDK